MVNGSLCNAPARLIENLISQWFDDSWYSDERLALARDSAQNNEKNNQKQKIKE